MYIDRLFGIGEPLIQRQRDHRYGLSKKFWLQGLQILDASDGDPCRILPSPNREKLDAEVTGMSREWFLPEGCLQKSSHAVPAGDLTERSLYMQALSVPVESWQTMASAFPGPPVKRTQESK